MKTVLFFMSGYSWAEKRSRDQVLRYARSARWRLQCIPYAQAGASRYGLLDCLVSRDIKGLLDYWKPDGCIVECGAAPDSLKPLDFPQIPTVFLDRDPSSLAGKASCVCCDNRRVAEAAFEELKTTGIRNFAFAGWHTPIYWSDQLGWTDICDTPYPEMIEAVREVGYRL